MNKLAYLENSVTIDPLNFIVPAPGPNPIYKIQRIILLHTGIRPITSVIGPFLSTVSCQIPAKSRLLH